MHDLELFRRSGVCFHPDVLATADKAYQSICEIHANSLTPYKAYKNRPLTPYQAQFNRDLARYRVWIEHVNRRIKRFRIFQGRYCNKQRGHFELMELICGIHNHELQL